ncbi:MAG: hypothetical protein PWP60_1119, partial [Candidatus Atribacteria bacterium]|nr:hypothetical protein [Candidatus Atribacteria bacterium]
KKLWETVTILKKLQAKEEEKTQETTKEENQSPK